MVCGGVWWCAVVCGGVRWCQALKQPRCRLTNNVRVMANRGTRDQGGYVLLLKQARWHLPSIQTQERWEGEVVSLGRRLRATPLVHCIRIGVEDSKWNRF